MSVPGDSDLLVTTRRALLDALAALGPHLDSVVLIGAQAIYLHTGNTPSIGLAEFTKDSDLALDPRTLASEPLLDEAMTSAGFHRDLTKPQPGSWLSSDGVPVDLMVPESLAGTGGPNMRGARIPPHSKHSARRARGLEATVVDHSSRTIQALAQHDERVYTVNVAGPAALLVAKLHKLGERQQRDPDRLLDKDAHDLYRLLVAVPTRALASKLRYLRQDELAGTATQHALRFLNDLFAAGADSLGCVMAGRAEEGVGEPETVAASAAALADDLLGATGRAAT